jgi:hypothetical protein
MNNKIVTWIALVISVVALGTAGYFLVSSRAGTSATPPCTIGEDPNCNNKPGQSPLAAAGTCYLVDGTSFNVSSVEECTADANWLKWTSPNGSRVIDNPNPATPPGGTGSSETDPQEIGACFTGNKPGPLPPPENPEYSYYIDTFANCLSDEQSYAFCIDEGATTPDSCEFIDHP